MRIELDGLLKLFACVVDLALAEQLHPVVAECRHHPCHGVLVLEVQSMGLPEQSRESANFFRTNARFPRAFKRETF